MNIDVVNDEDFEDVVVAASTTKPVLVDFVADFCGPCKLIEPLLRELHSQGEVTVVKAKPEEAPRFKEWLAKQGKHVAALPTCVLFEGGAPKRTLVGGFTAAKLQSFLGSAVRGAVRSATPQAARLQPVHVPVAASDSPHARWSRKARIDQL